MFVAKLKPSDTFGLVLFNSRSQIAIDMTRKGSITQ